MTIESSKKIDSLYEILNSAINTPEPTPVEPSQPPMVFFLGGSIIGSLAAVLLVIYLNKSIARKHMKGKIS
jgi:hypothetical protein